MAWRAIEEARPGMMLEGDLVTPQGRRLLRAGASLTGSSLAKAVAAGITRVDVRDDAPDASPEALAAARDLARRRFLLTNHRHSAVREAARAFVQVAAARHRPEELREMTGAYEPDPDLKVEPSGPLDGAALVQGEVRLASLPAIFFEISEALGDPRSSSSYMADIISKDVAISARLLRMVNTPFYGFPGRIDSLSRAVTIIGVEQLVSLAQGISVITAFEGIPKDLLDLKGFWLHSIMCGTLARLLASHHGIANDERFFVAGLLHDIGRLVVLRNLPERALEPLQACRVKPQSVTQAEMEFWGTTHSEIGADLMRAWKLPQFLEHLLRYHHSPSVSPVMLESAIVHAADFMANALGTGRSGDLYVPRLDKAAWELLSVTPERFRRLALEAENQSHQIMEAFFDEA
jgi:HD-like signal output (HDOD) protein